MESFYKLLIGSLLASSIALIVACTDGQLVSYGNNSNSNGNSPPVAFTELGQPNFNSLLANNGGVSATSLSNPNGIATDGTRLFVADSGNHRVLIWNSIPSAIDQPADLVLGQPNMTSNVANNGSVSAYSLYMPTGLYATSTKLYVSDAGNHRVLVYSYPYSTYMGATLVLGQTGFSVNTLGSALANTFSYPLSITSDSTYLYVADSAWNRVSAFTLTGLTSNQSATFILGQPGASSYAAGTSSTTFSGASGVFYLNAQIFVTELNNNRLMGFNINSTTGEAASTLVGQLSYSSNYSGTSSTAFSSPQAVFGDMNHMMVVDTYNNRVVEFNAPFTTGMAASYVYGQSSLNSGGVSGTSDQSLFSPAAGCELNGAVYVSDPGNNRVMVFSER